MPELTLLAAAAGVAVLLGASLQSATGFGFGLLSGPLLFAAAGPQQAVGLLMVLGLEMNVLTLAGEGRRPQPLRHDAVRLLAWAVPGSLFGVFVLRVLDEATLQVLVTLGVLASLAVRRRRLRSSAAPSPPPRWAIPATGLAAGTLNTSTSASGPPLVLYLLRRGARPAETRDTLTVIFLVHSLIGGLALAVTRTSGAIPEAVALAVLVPLVAVGHATGRRLFARLDAERYELALTVTLVGAALAGLATVVW